MRSGATRPKARPLSANRSMIYGPQPKANRQPGVVCLSGGTGEALAVRSASRLGGWQKKYQDVTTWRHPGKMAWLSHFLGAPHHPDPENIMSYGRDRHRFDDRQVEAFRATARRFARAGWAR